jgi:mutator protein MutT
VSHRIAVAVLLDNDQVLLCLRSRTRQWYPGVWDLPGGHIEDGETAADALRRELNEELGVAARVTEPFAHIITDDYEMVVFIVSAWRGTVSNNAPDEHDEVRFVTIAEATKLPLADDYVLSLLTRALSDRPTETIVETTPHAPWLPAGGKAEAAVDLNGIPRAPTGLVRPLIRRNDEVFCTPRDSGKVDLPTRAVPDLDDGRSAAENLAQLVLGEARSVNLLGFVRNIVDTPDAQYPWPTPLAYFSVWEACGDPVIDGQWVSITDDRSPLRERHWWPIVAQP